MENEIKSGKKQTVRTREAPSPTGFPHVGTAFQALFNWVYAHKHKGQFIVRIEDTDRKRFVETAEKVIFDGLEWLGLTPNESPIHGGPFGPYRQSERLEIYNEYAKRLVEEDKAYYCFCSEERLAKMREDQQKKGLPPRYDRICLKLTKEEVSQKIKNGEKSAIRMKIPQGRKIVVHDLLRGEVEFDSNLLDDQVILKSDGFPTYHLGVVVDDHLMQITHMKRGEEWLPSAPKHILLYEYFAWQPPLMIHTPIIRNPDKSKLSKRQGHTNLWWYRAHGYLPEALLNFLASLVWNHPEGKEIFTKEEMMKYFEWEQMRYLGPIFDLTKLEWVNGEWIRQKDLEELIKDIIKWASWVKDYQGENPSLVSPLERGENKEGLEEIKKGAEKIWEWINLDREYFYQCLKLAQERLKEFSELSELLEFYYEKKLKFDQEDLLQKHESGEVIKALNKIKEMLGSSVFWEHETWDKGIRNLADSFSWKHKDLFMILRSATTARKATPPLFEVMTILGKDRVFDRINQAIEYLKSI